MSTVPIITLATKITIGRILLIPVFVWAALKYTATVSLDSPDENWRWIAIAIFSVAALGDVLDGYVARVMNQQTWLGGVLDPLADKLLLITAIVLLTFSSWPERMPIWFIGMVLLRDIIAIGWVFYQRAFATVNIQPHWWGKGATFFQMLACVWVMLQIRIVPSMVPIVLAAIFITGSGIYYFFLGSRQIAEHNDEIRRKQGEGN